MISSSMWVDEKFVLLSREAQLAWIYLLTGQENRGSVPGLLSPFTVGNLVSSPALRLSLDEALGAMRQLVELTMVEVDAPRCLLRIPNAPIYNQPGNPNVVEGWFRRWRDLPPSPLKWDHIDSIEAAIMMPGTRGKTREHIQKTFLSTFATVRQHRPGPSSTPPNGRKQGELAGFGQSGQTETNGRKPSASLSGPGLRLLAESSTPDIEHREDKVGSLHEGVPKAFESLGRGTGTGSVSGTGSGTGSDARGRASPRSAATGQAPVEKHHPVSPPVPFRLP